MIKCKCYIILLAMLVSFSCGSQNKYSERDEAYSKLLDSFTDYIKNSVKDRKDIIDSSHLKHIALNYLFVDSKLDSSDVANLKSSELSNEKINILKNQLKSFRNFLFSENNLAKNLKAMPIRLMKDKIVYNELSSFQKENTWALYDSRSPEKSLVYILFIPPVERVISAPRIWSWVLTFQYGKYLFKSVTGEEGHELIFSPR